MKKIFNFLILVSLFTLTTYLIFSIFQSIFYKKDYSIDFSDNNFKNTKNVFYIDEEKNSPIFESLGELSDKTTYAKINNTPISLIFQPTEYTLNKEQEFSLLFKGSGDWKLSTICESCSIEKKYDWAPLYTSKFGNDRYFLIKYIDNLYVYSTQEIKNNNADDIFQWIKQNIEEGSSIEFFSKKQIDKNYFVNPDIDFKKNTYTEIDKTLRGHHEFYVYLENDIDIEILKEDLNLYEGPESIYVRLYDLNDNLVFEKIIEDDGIVDASREIKSVPIKKMFKEQINKKGVFRLSFNDVSFSNSDWLIKKFKINTNKVILTDDINLIIDPAVIYTTINSLKKINVDAWHKEAVQKINFISNKHNTKELNIGAENLGKINEVILEPDEYAINVQGDQHLSGAYFAFQKENYFEPFLYDFKNYDNPNFIISDFYYSEEGSWIRSSITIPRERIENSKIIKLLLKNDDINANYNKEKDLLSSWMTPISTFNNITLFGKVQSMENDFIKTDLNNWLESLVPLGSKIITDKIINLPQLNFVNKKIEETASIELKEINCALRGSHQFYVYFKTIPNIKIYKKDLNWYNGDDIAKVALTTLDETPLCEMIIADDGNTSNNRKEGIEFNTITCPEVSKGLYLLTVKAGNNPDPENENDFFINKIIMNTNKLLAKDKILNIEPIKLFASNNFDRNINFYYWHKDKNQVVTITNNNAEDIFEITENDFKKNINYILKKGDNEILSSKGDVIFSGSNFSFDKDGWFMPFTINFVDEKSEADFTLLQKDDKNNFSYIKKIEMHVK